MIQVPSGPSQDASGSSITREEVVVMPEELDVDEEDVDFNFDVQGGVEAPDPADFEECAVASGESRGVPWRLFLVDGCNGGFLCIELRHTPPPETCGGSFGEDPEAGWPREAAFMGRPTTSDGEPTFVFGTIEAGVARVAVELGPGDLVDAELVGDRRAHYVIALPDGASPQWVVAYSADGKELARRGFQGEEFDNQPEEQWEECGETPDGGYECRGGASGSETVSGYGGVEDDEQGGE